MIKKKYDIKWSIFIPSVIILFIAGFLFAMIEGDAIAFLNGVFDVIVANFGWAYIWYSILILGAAFWFVFSKYGKVVLGDPNSKPDYTMFEYACLLVAMGIGSSILRTGTMQWVTVYMQPPAGVEAYSMEALMWGQPYGMFLWGLQVFAIFVMTGPAIAYMVHVRKKPMVRISEVCRVLFGDKFSDGIGGKILDVLFIVSITAGAAVFLGFGAPMVIVSIEYLTGTTIGFFGIFMITILWAAAFTISSYLGLDKSIKFLSVLNMKLAAVFGLLILLIGPGVFIIEHFTDSIGFFIRHYIDLSFYSNSLRGGGGTDFMHTFSIFWFAYCATWALVHGVYAARVSKGRTIREMILTYLFAPLILTTTATGILGGVSIERYLTGVVDVPGLVAAAGGGGGGMVAAIPHVLSSLPMGTVILVAFLIMVIIFLTTTMDSTSYSIAMYASTDDMGKREPSQAVRLITSFVIVAIALIFMNIGGLAPLEVMSGLMGIPIIFIQFITIWAAKRMMDQDKAWLYNVRPPKETLEQPTATVDSQA